MQENSENIKRRSKGLESLVWQQTTCILKIFDVCVWHLPLETLTNVHVPYLWTILCTQSVCHIFGNEQFSFSFGQPAFISCYESMLHVSFTCNTFGTSNRHITVFLQVYSIEKRKKIGMKRPWEQNNWIPFYHYTFCRVKSVPSFRLTFSAPGT